MAGARNHKGVGPEESDIVMDFLCREAPGSFGLLYWSDDEDMALPPELIFKVKVLARGRVVERYDPFLSPMIPTVEDDLSGDP